MLENMERVCDNADKPWGFSEPSPNLVPVEFDAVDRLATLYLFKYSKGGTEVDRIADLPQWAVVFRFEDASWRTVEGRKGSNNEIIPSFLKCGPTGDGIFYEMGEMIIAPARLRVCVLNNISNGKPYMAENRNHQDWVLGFAAGLGDAHVEKIKNYHCLPIVRDPRETSHGADVGRATGMLFGAANTLWSYGSKLFPCSSHVNYGELSEFDPQQAKHGAAISAAPKQSSSGANNFS